MNGSEAPAKASRNATLVGEGASVDDAGAGAVGAAGVDAVEQHAS